MTSVNSHFSSHFPPVYYIVVDIQFARHATFSTPHTHFLLQLLCEFAPAVAVSVFVLTKASLLSLRICMFFLPLQYIKFPSARYSLHSHRFASHAPRLRLGIRCTHINTQKEPYAHKWSLAPFSYLHESLCVYIIPMPPPIGGAAGVSSLISATTDSVVNNVDATEVAFCNAERVTFTGSMIPASTMFT